MSPDSTTSTSTSASTPPSEPEGEAKSEVSLPVGRFGRLLSLIAFVTAVFLFISSQTLSGRLFSIAVVVVGAVAVVTAITGFLISVASYVGGE